MKKRNNVVSLLMDKVPRRNKEGYTKSGSMEGHILLVELSGRDQVAEFVNNHATFCNLPSFERNCIYQAILSGTVPHNTRSPGRNNTTYLLKIRIMVGQRGQMYTPLAWLATRFSNMFVFVTDGVVNPTYDRGQESSTMTAATFVELGADLPMLVCECPDDLPPDAFDFAAHGVRVE